MGGSESVIDVDVCWSSQLLGEFWVILGLFLVETDIFEQKDLSVRHFLELGLNWGSNAVVSLEDWLAEELGQTWDDWVEAELVLWAILGATQVGGEEDLGTIVAEVLEGWDGSTDTGVVSDGRAIERDLFCCCVRGRERVRGR